MNPDQTADSSSHCNKTFYHNQKEIKGIFYTAGCFLENENVLNLG